MTHAMRYRRIKANIGTRSIVVDGPDLMLEGKGG